MKNLERRIKLRIKAPLHSFKAGAHIGFENTLAEELSMLGINECEVQSGAVHFKAKLESVWQVIILSRCARSFEMKIAEFRCENFGRLEHEIKNIAWELYLPQNCKANVKTFTEKSRLYHKGAVEERVAEIVTKCLGYGLRDKEHETKLNIRLKNDICSVWLDLCGEALHKRGARWVENAPMQETLAASILLCANFAKYEKLIDPMAGSGVFSMEAAKWRSKLKLMRRFDFMEMPSFREAAFNNFLQKAKQPFALKENEIYEILCSDKSEKAVKTLLHNAENNAPQHLISITRSDFFFLPPAQNALLVLNPPYGKRLGREKELYKEIAKKIEKDFSKCAFAIICPLAETQKLTAMSRPVKEIQTYNGGLKTGVFIGK